jgi:hypothetical protein
MEQWKIAIEIVGVIALIFLMAWLRAKVRGKTDMDVLLGDNKPQSIFGDEQDKNSR